MGTVIGVALLLLVVVLNILASRRVIFDDWSGRQQKFFQLMIVWLVPFLGAMLVYKVTRQNLPRGSGTYSQEKAEMDDGSGITGRRKSSATESDVADSDN